MIEETTVGAECIKGDVVAQSPQIIDDTKDTPCALINEAKSRSLVSSSTISTPLPYHNISVSRSASDVMDNWKVPQWLSFVEYPFRIQDGGDGSYLPEVTGWGMDAAARGPLNQLGSFVGSAVLRMAALDAGCASPKNCSLSVYGGPFKPSSLLTATSAIVGIVAALLMPFVGALVDHTRHRKLLGTVSGFFIVLLTGMQISISLEPINWLFILVLDACGTFSMLVHATVVFAYLPDFSTEEDSISTYTSFFQIHQYIGQIIFALSLLLANNLRGADRSIQSTVRTASDGAGIAFGMGLLLIGYAWMFLFSKRPALSQIPEGQSFLATGFIQVKNTSQKIAENYKALKWFMISLLLSPEAGAGVVLAIVVSFLVTDVQISSTELLYTGLVLMGGNIVGALFSKLIVRKINPLNSYRAGMLCLAFSIGISSGIIRGPENKNAVYGLACWWGFSMGWMYPSQRVLICTLIPKGQETEMMGLFTFMGQIFGWLPPLIVTIMNENGVELRYGILVITGFCVFAFFCTLPMGSYKAAIAQVAVDSADKLLLVCEAAKTHGGHPKTTLVDRVVSSDPVVTDDV